MTEWVAVGRDDWCKKGDRCVSDDGRHGLVRARVHTTTGDNMRLVVNWDDGTGGIIDAGRVRKEDAQ